MTRWFSLGDRNSCGRITFSGFLRITVVALERKT
jgi:hypothetical protein